MAIYPRLPFLRTLRTNMSTCHGPSKARPPLSRIFNNDPTKGPLKVPGFECPIDEVYYRIESEKRPWDRYTAFSHGFSSWIQSRRNLVRELHMIGVMDALTDKAQWNVKVFDDDILAKWEAEAMNLPGRLINAAAWTWIVKELRWKAEKYSENGYLTTMETSSTIVKADTLIGEDTRKELQKAVQPMIEIDDAGKDWHPGSDEKVLNLVHPSLYPLVYGRTRILPSHALGINDYLLDVPADSVIIDVPPAPAPERYNEYGIFLGRFRSPNPDLWSAKFQWLPCDVDFAGPSGDEVRIVSYINSLLPAKYPQLYRIIERIIGKSIQPWNEVLSWGHHNEDCPRVWQEGEIKQIPDPFEDPYTLGNIMSDLSDMRPENVEDRERMLQVVKEYLARPDNPDRIVIPREWEYPRRPFDPSFAGEWWSDLGLEDELEAKQERTRVTQHPEPDVGGFVDWKEGRETRLKPKIEEDFRESGLQVFVKLSSIELTPEKPEYDGGNWHLEGKLNEHIVATSIYYYDVENVTETRIQFRQEANMDMDDVEYSVEDHGPTEDAYGVRNLHDCEAIQETGSVLTRQGRLLVFPNMVQHRVEPFRLEDPKKPGHRRFLVIWLVDPHYRIISTRNVAPQQHNWWKDEAFLKGQGQESSRAGNFVDGVMSQAEAEQYRLDLMKERTTVMDGVSSYYERYNFCEH